MMRLSDLETKLEELERLCQDDTLPQDYKDHLTRLKNAYGTERNRALAMKYASEEKPPVEDLGRSRGMWR